MPLLKTNKDLERHAGEIYTYANFYNFQDEFWNACMDFKVVERQAIDEGYVISIADNSRNRATKRKVIYNPSTHEAYCSCKMFECEGFPCCHTLCVLMGKVLRELPSYYVMNRLTKMAGSKSIFDVNGIILEECSQMEHED